MWNISLASDSLYDLLLLRNYVFLLSRPNSRTIYRYQPEIFCWWIRFSKENWDSIVVMPVILLFLRSQSKKRESISYSDRIVSILVSSRGHLATFDANGRTFAFSRFEIIPWKTPRNTDRSSRRKFWFSLHRGLKIVRREFLFFHWFSMNSIVIFIINVILTFSHWRCFPSTKIFSIPSFFIACLFFWSIINIWKRFDQCVDAKILCDTSAEENPHHFKEVFDRCHHDDWIIVKRRISINEKFSDDELTTMIIASTEENTEHHLHWPLTFKIDKSKRTKHSASLRVFFHIFIDESVSICVWMSTISEDSCSPFSSSIGRTFTNHDTSRFDSMYFSLCRSSFFFFV